MTTAVVYDYGFGNVRSMGACARQSWRRHHPHLRLPAVVGADGLVVPGVGAFAACMEGLKKVDGDRVIYDASALAARCSACAWASRSCSNTVWSTVPMPQASD